jgi:hypothetical protein
MFEGESFPFGNCDSRGLACRGSATPFYLRRRDKPFEKGIVEVLLDGPSRFSLVRTGMETLPLWSVISYNALSLHQTRRMRHILSDFRWNSFVCIQGSQRRTYELVLQHTVGEWGNTISIHRKYELHCSFLTYRFESCGTACCDLFG